MSITDELREWSENRILNAELAAIADRIDAEHQKAEDEWKAKGGQSWLHGYSECRAELMEGNEAIAADLEEAGWVQLPKDADGEVIHIGDVLDGGDEFDGFSKTITVDWVIMSANCWMLKDTNGMLWYNTSAFTHHVERTAVKDVMVEFATDWECAQDGEDKTAVLKEYAAKLRLANSEE